MHTHPIWTTLEHCLSYVTNSREHKIYSDRKFQRILKLKKQLNGLKGVRTKELSLPTWPINTTFKCLFLATSVSSSVLSGAETSSTTGDQEQNKYKIHWLKL